MKKENLFKKMQWPAILLICITTVAFYLYKSNSNNRSWLIDCPIYDIRLGDNLMNIPKSYKLTDYNEELNVFFLASPYEEISEVTVMVDENMNIYSLGFKYKTPNFETFKQITNDAFKAQFGVEMDIEMDANEKNSDNINAQGFCILDYDGQLIGVKAMCNSKSLLFPKGNVSIHYAHQKLLKRYAQKGKPAPSKEISSILKAFLNTMNEKDNEKNEIEPNQQ
jgi:hypothetical protein